MYLQSASLGVVSPGNPRIMDNMLAKAKNDTAKNDYYDYSSQVTEYFGCLVYMIQ
jgi:hypothetical protein